MSYMQNTLAYKTIKFEYEQYTLNAVQAGEHPMPYASWLSRYKCVCSEDIRMLVARRKKQLYK